MTDSNRDRTGSSGTADTFPDHGAAYRLRPATPDDCGDIQRLVGELARYEKEPDAAVATADDFARALFPGTGEPVAHAVLAQVGDRVVGLALWFRTFSTWTGRPGMHLEDLFVEPESRGLGIGRGLLTHLAAECVARDWPRMDWSVLTWNTPSIDFYESLGAQRQSEWVGYRLDGDALGAAAATSTTRSTP